MKTTILISIDDTDDLESRGTGDVAELLAAGIEANGWGTCGRVTRHQLLIHPDVPYTSHNSSMCFPAEVEAEALEQVTDWCCATLAAESVAASDPGLCVAALDKLSGADALISYGRAAKQRVFTKQEAYETALRCGAHLSEHGGTGQGVIGALAGVALRLGGNDGRFKGRLHIPSADGVTSVSEIRRCGVDEVRSLEGDVLASDALVNVGEAVKPVLLDNMSVLLVVPAEDGESAAWKACDRRTLKSY